MFQERWPSGVVKMEGALPKVSPRGRHVDDFNFAILSAVQDASTLPDSEAPHNMTCLMFGPVFQKDEFFHSDGLHLSAAGLRLLKTILHAVAKAPSVRSFSNYSLEQWSGAKFAEEFAPL